MRKEEIENTVFEDETESELSEDVKEESEDKSEKKKEKKKKEKKEKPAKEKKEKKEKQPKEKKEKKEKKPKEKKEKIPKTPEQKAEIKRTVKTALLVALTVAAVIYVLLFYNKNIRAENEKNKPKEQTLDLAGITLSETSVITPYVTTDIPGVAYTVNTAKEVKFFQFDGTQYVDTPETGNISVLVPLSSQHIPVDIHYLRKDGKLTGFGLFTAAQDVDVYIYDFMLCKITDLPKGYEQDGKCLLLAATKVTAAYALDPVWEEAYVLDLESGSCRRFLSEGNRMLGINGAVRSDFCMINADALRSDTGKIPFYSSRAYDVSSENKQIDIYLKNGTSESAAVRDVADKYVKPTSDGGFIYIRNTEGGFNTEHYLNGESVTVQEFYSSYGEQYIRSGDYILSKEDGRLYTTYDTSVVDLPEFKMNPNEIAVSPDGSYIVMAGTGANVLDYVIYIYNVDTGKYVVFNDPDYSVHANLFFPTNNKVCFYTQDVNGFNEKIIDISKVF